MDEIRGAIYEHKKTKELLHYLPVGSIVFLWHEDLDGVTVDGLIKAKVKAVINGNRSLSGSYVHHHVTALLDAGIMVFDVINLNRSNEETYQGKEALIQRNELFIIENGSTFYVAKLLPYTSDLIKQRLAQARMQYGKKFEQFVANTLTYAKDECEWFQKKPSLPVTFERMKGKDVFIVARNTEYEKDIHALRQYLRQKHVIIIAVDGAADGLLDNQIYPHFIIGDMDSISKKALTCGAKLYCHEHPNGMSPGKERLKKVGVDAETIRFVGTSEDVAIVSAYWSGARQLYLIGCRIGMMEFLEKARRGMGATWLSRMQAGDRVTDLKGIHRLLDRKQFVPSRSRTEQLTTFLKRWIPKLFDRQTLAKKKEAFRHD